MTKVRGDEQHRAVLAEVVDELVRGAIPYVVIGGIASSIHGRPGEIEDIDLLVAHEGASRLQAALLERGFDYEESDEPWLLKAKRQAVLVDLIFDACGMTLDGAMLDHASTENVVGRDVVVVGPEDLVVMLALASREGTDYWHNGINIVRRAVLDWPYLVARAAAGPLRVASLLLYARSDGAAVPDEVVEELLRLPR